MSDETAAIALTIQMLLDERDIHRALASFARIADTKSFDALADVFTEDVRFDYGTGKVESGLGALRALLAGHLGRCGGTQHLIGSIVVDVDGDSAVSRAYVKARHQRARDALGPVFDSNGEYTDTWHRRPEGWRIVQRCATWATTSGDPRIIAEGGELS
jgi:ketosteroid isomerase-like protein